MSHYLYTYSAPFGAALAALALFFAFLGWMKARANSRQLEFVLQDLNRRTSLPTPDEVAKAVMRRMAAQQQTTSEPTHNPDDSNPRLRNPYSSLADLAPAVGTARPVEQPNDETRIHHRPTPDPRRATTYIEQPQMNLDDDRELPRFDPYQGFGGDYGPRSGVFTAQRASYMEPAMG